MTAAQIHTSANASLLSELAEICVLGMAAATGELDDDKNIAPVVPNASC